MFNNSLLLDMDETDSSILFKSGWHLNLNRRWGLTSSDRINNNSTAFVTLGRDPVWSSSAYTLNIEMEQDNQLQSACVYLCPWIQICTRAHTRTHKTMLRPDPPICSRSFRKPQNQTSASLFQLPFFPPPSPHQIYLNSPTISFFSPPVSLISSASMCYHH